MAVAAKKLPGMGAVTRLPRLELFRIEATTPVLLRGAMAAVVALAVLAGVVSLWAAASIANTAQTVGRDAEPSVALALGLQSTLSDMDADAIGAALVKEAGSGEAAGGSARFRAAEQRLVADMVEAARNITYGEAEAAPLRNLQLAVFAYAGAVAEQRAAEQRAAEQRAAGPGELAARAEAADRVVRTEAAPQAQALAKANADVLEARYAAYRSGSLVFGLAGVAGFGLLAAGLVAVQVWLAGRVRRILNPLLVAATLVTAGAGLWFGATVVRERADLFAAKADAYDSLHVLFESKVALNTLRAGMSIWLLDPPARAATLGGMNAALRSLIGPGLSDPGLAGRLAEAQRLEHAGQAGAARAAVPSLGGTLGGELDNVTFGSAERDPATETVGDLVRATALIANLQRAEPGAHAASVASWLGSGAALFGSATDAVDRTIAVNQSEFDRRITAALGTARVLPVVVVSALLLTALLAAGGLWQRLREYR